MTESIAAEQIGTQTRRKASPITPRTERFLAHQVAPPAEPMQIENGVGIFMPHC
jgi:hypothetical protein